MKESRGAPNEVAYGTRQAATAAHWLGETALFTALGLVWVAFGFALLTLPEISTRLPSSTILAWLALGACGYGLLRPASATLGRGVFLAMCIAALPYYYMAGWRTGDVGPAFRMLTPAEFATWLWRGTSSWFGEGPDRYGPPWIHALVDVLALTGAITVGLLLGRLAKRRLLSPRRPDGPPPAPAD